MPKWTVGSIYDILYVVNFFVNIIGFARFGVLTAALKRIQVFWDVFDCWTWMMDALRFSKTSITTNRGGVRCQKTWILIFICYYYRSVMYLKFASFLKRISLQLLCDSVLHSGDKTWTYNFHTFLCFCW